MAQRMTWNEICARPDCKGRWVALYGCRYDDAAQPAEGSLVDVDDNLAELCNRVRDSHWKNCSIVFCAN